MSVTVVTVVSQKRLVKFGGSDKLGLKVGIKVFQYTTVHDMNLF